jgi:hypothetical protein
VIVKVPTTMKNKNKETILSTPSPSKPFSAAATNLRNEGYVLLLLKVVREISTPSPAVT